MEITPIITAFLCAAILLLILIFLLLLSINQRLGTLSLKLTKSPSHDKKQAVSGDGVMAVSNQPIEVPSGTRFAEFLDEDPARRSLPKKEQFESYRLWRKEKGLNWQSND